jgi:allophanate hydrolase
MPLNSQLTVSGATFDRAIATSPHYRLFALSGQATPKPGLIRSAHGDGVSIETEIWRLTPEAFASFVVAIPAPLSVGTITLADGSSAKGFLVEPAGLDGATDISSYGGWRAFCNQ